MICRHPHIPNRPTSPIPNSICTQVSFQAWQYVVQAIIIIGLMSKPCILGHKNVFPMPAFLPRHDHIEQALSAHSARQLEQALVHISSPITFPGCEQKRERNMQFQMYRWLTLKCQCSAKFRGCYRINGNVKVSKTRYA